MSAARTPLRTLNSNSRAEEPPSKKNDAIETIAIPNTTRQLKLLAELGEGSFGTVFRGYDADHGIVAVKECCDGAEEEVQREAAAHRALEAHYQASGGGEGLFARLFYHVTMESRSLLVMELIPGVELEE